MLERCLT